jgi:phosphate-selective porin OprO/OprP
MKVSMFDVIELSHTHLTNTVTELKHGLQMIHGLAQELPLFLTMEFHMKKTLFSANRVALAVAVICSGVSLPAFAQVEAKVTGRVHFDARNISSGLNAISDRDSASLSDNFEMRRARIGITGSINKDIGYEVVGNAVGSNTNFIDTAFANYGFNKAAQFRAGRFKQPFSLEELTSSNSIDFMERSYGNQMVPGKRLGLMMHGEPMKGLNYGISVFQDGFSESSNSSNTGSNSAMRLAINGADFGNMENTVLHLGVAKTSGTSQVVPTTSGNTEDAATDTTRATIISMRSENRGLANAFRAQIGGDKIDDIAYGASANNVININKDLKGLELAVARGPFKLQMENFDTKYEASGTTQDLTGALADAAVRYDVRVKAQYVEFMYNITGEDWSKAYKGGAFSGITPTSVFMKDYGGVVGNGIGAWQVGVRQSSYEAEASNSVAGRGGSNRVQNSPKATTTTYALNWIMNNNARVMLNYAETNFGTAVEILDTGSDSSTTTKERVVSLRTQINF